MKFFSLSKKLFLILNILFVFSQPAFAKIINESSDSFKLSAETGYRVDNLNWGISGFNSVFKIGSNYYLLPTSSELGWKNIKIAQTKINASLPLVDLDQNLKGNLFLDGSFAHGLIFSGQNQDSDFVGNSNNKLEFSRSNNQAKKGSTNDYSIALNYRINLSQLHFLANKQDQYFLTPVLGYAFNQQNLTMTNGNQTINLVNDGILGAFSGLNSTYKTSWQGPFIGFAFETKLNQKHSLQLAAKHHFVDYYAQANWNLRSDFAHPKSFEHKANGSGNAIDLKYSFKLGQNLSYNVAFNYQKFSTQNGTNQTFFADGVTKQVRLDRVKWDSRALMLGVGYEF